MLHVAAVAATIAGGDASSPSTYYCNHRPPRRTLLLPHIICLTQDLGEICKILESLTQDLGEMYLAQDLGEMYLAQDLGEIYLTQLWPRATPTYSKTPHQLLLGFAYILCLHRCVSDVLALPCPQIQRKGHFVTYKTVCKLLYGGSVMVTGDMHDQSMIKSHHLARKHTDCGPTPGLTTLDNFFIT